MNSFVYRFPGSHEVAAHIGAPFVREGPTRGTTSLTGYAMDRGAKAVWIEMGGAGAHEEEWAARIATGLRRAFGKTGVLAEAAMQEADVTLLTGAATSFRASHPGLYLPELREAAVGTVVPAQALIGSLIDAVTGNVIETYGAPYERTAMLLLRPRIGVLEGGEIVGVVATID